MKQIIKMYKNSVKAIIKNITGSSNEDIEQEVYLKTWKNLDNYKENGKFKQWINTITSNLCKDYLKSSNNKNAKNYLPEEETLKISSQKDNVEDLFDSKQRKIKVSRAILQLRPKLQDVIVMYEIEGMDYDEIAKKLKCPVGTVKSRIFKARQELYTLLKEIL